MDWMSIIFNLIRCVCVMTAMLCMGIDLFESKQGFIAYLCLCIATGI
jgi:hypothetical protein